jgi:hypothetical protein
VGFKELSCAVSDTLKNNRSMPTTVVDRWKIFLVIIPILFLYSVLLVSLLAAAAESRLHDPINVLLSSFIYRWVSGK